MGRRYSIQGTFTDSQGNVVASGTITVYVCADDETNDGLAEIYAAKTGGSPVAGSYVTSDSNGFWQFYYDDETYPLPGGEFNILFQAAGLDDAWRKSVR